MEKEKALMYIETSFLSPLLKNEDVTDISYNGVSIFYVSNSEGRKKSDILVEQQQIRDFIRQIANLCESQFSFTAPELDKSIGKYRIHAIHHSIGKVFDEGVVTFSIRIASEKIKIDDNCDFFTLQVVGMVDVLLHNQKSIIIGGTTSSGKTEFQKYLLTKLEENSRVIVVDNVLELDRIRSEKMDLTCWECSDKNENATANKLIKAALRNNPDWLILAEARDKEMIDVLNSAMTGMPIITTLHSYDVYSLPHRMGRMMLKGEQKIDFNEALNDIYYHFHYYFYLKKETVDGHIKRYISQICYFDNDGNPYLLYERKNNESFYYKLPECATKELDLGGASDLFMSTFVR